MGGFGIKGAGLRAGVVAWGLGPRGLGSGLLFRVWG